MKRKSPPSQKDSELRNRRGTRSELLGRRRERIKGDFEK